MRKMKDSGLSWIDEIPYTWKTARVKYLFSSSKGLPITKENLIENGLPVISYGQIHSKSNSGVNISEELLRFVDFSYHSLYPRSQVFNGSFVFADTSEDLDGCGNCVYKRDDNLLFAGYHSIVLISKATTDNRFLAYLFKTDAWRKQIRELVSGVKVFSISQSALLNASIILPPLDEQKRIADFLDKECKKIDGLKADIQLQIDTLEQYKRSVITEAVTHGLNHNAPVKDSGVDYIDEIKADWKISKIGFVCTKLARGFSEDDPALICSNKGNVVFRDEQHACGKMVSEDNAMQGIHIGDIAIHGMDTWHGAIGFSKIRGKITRVVHVCDSTEDKRFIVYYLKSLAYQGVYKLISNGIRGNTSDFRSWDKVKDIYICLPSIVEEEKQICDYLDSVIESVDKVIVGKKAQLDMLDEYKKSLIYEYVTGKKVMR